VSTQLSQPREKIVLAEGLVADFYPSSWCVERRLLLTAGRLDAHNADLVFGVFNAGRDDVEFGVNVQLARATFAWLGRDNMPVYSGPPPGAYIPQLDQLRAREDALNSAEDALRAQREEIIRLRESLLAQSKDPG
jgi:hypothetical protein